MFHFDASCSDAIPSATIFQQAVSLGGNVPQAYLCCENTTTGPKIFCLHLPSKFIGSFDGTTTPWEDLSFAILGKVVQVLVSIISFLEEAFNNSNIQIKTVDYMLQHQDDLNDLPVFPPVHPGKANSQLVTT
jgi:hypothetical protein